MVRISILGGVGTATLTLIGTTCTFITEKAKKLHFIAIEEAFLHNTVCFDRLSLKEGVLGYSANGVDWNLGS